MATFSRVTLLALAAGVALGVSGCVAAPALPAEPGPAPSASPVFASEEEALAAATEAYAAYQAMSDVIASEGGAAAERIKAFATEQYQAEDMASYEGFSEQGLFSRGSSTFDSLRLQQYSAFMATGDRLTAYLCYDVSDVTIMNSDGVDVTPGDRPNRLPLEIEFAIAEADPLQLRIARSDIWSGANFC